MVLSVSPKPLLSDLINTIGPIMPYFNGVLLVLLVLGAVAWKITTSRRTVASAPLPPGPPADPIIGHVRVNPTDRREVCYQKWGKEFKSDELYLNLTGQPLIILNSLQAAIDLMDKRSSIYSDRPSFHMAEGAGWRDCIVFLSTGSQFRKHRGMFQTAFASSNTAQYRIKQESLARPLIRRIPERPGDWREHLWRYAGSIVLAIA
jgi:cytochrome P450